MSPLVSLALSFLRVATHASLFLEAQRLLLRLVRPTRQDHLRRLEAHVLRDVRAPLTHRFIPDADGHVIHVLDIPARRPDAPTAVLLHGHSMSAAFWFRNMDDLAAQGYRVLAPDLLGWGRSGRPRFHGHTADHSVDWYLRSLSAVLSALSSGPALLVGHSLGAYLAMEYTARNPQNVQKLVLVSPAAAVRPVSFARAVYFSLPPQRIVRRGGLFGFFLFVAKYPRSDVYLQYRLRDFTYHLANQYPSSGESAVRPIIRFRGLSRAECARPLIENLPKLFDIPVQIVCGDSDSSMSVEGVYALYREMKQRNFDVRLDVVQGCDHCPQIEKPEEFSQIVATFAKTCGPAVYAGNDNFIIES